MVIASVDRVTTISAYGGHVVWSARDPATGAYRLADLYKGKLSYLPVPERSVPFDVDVGPGPDGRLLAAYSRCVSEPVAVDFNGLPRWAQASGCGIRLHTFGTRGERRLAGDTGGNGSHFLPSVWHDRIGYFQTGARERRVRGVVVPRLVVRRVKPPVRARELPVGNVPRDPQFPANWLTPTALDLARGGLVFGWAWSAEGYGHGITEVRLLNSFRARRSLLIAYGVVGEGCLHIVQSPALDHGRITFVRRETCGPAAVERYAIASGRRSRARVTGDPISLARDPSAPLDSVALLVAQPGVSGPPDPCSPRGTVEPQPETQPCTLLHARELKFRAESRRGPLPDSADLPRYRSGRPSINGSPLGVQSRRVADA